MRKLYRLILHGEVPHAMAIDRQKTTLRPSLVALSSLPLLVVGYHPLRETATTHQHVGSAKYPPVSSSEVIRH
jgi:hypothetical protein